MFMDINFGNSVKVDCIRFFDYISFYKTPFPKTLVFGNIFLTLIDRIFIKRFGLLNIYYLFLMS